MTHIADYDTKKQYQATVKKSLRFTPENVDEIRELILEIESPEFQCEVDQSFGVLIKTKTDFGNEYHHRLYSVADIPFKKNGKTQITMLVKRCSYIDEFSGEVYPGIGSNYLCDRAEGDTITITGPFKLPFVAPEDKKSNMILIGMGTGIAPFRAFIKHIYSHVKNWEGKIRLFYGAKSGLELIYMNDKNSDLVNYYDESTFEAFQALSPRPEFSDPIALDKALEDQKEEILELLSQSNTYVYVAGYEKIREKLDSAFSNIFGSKEKWHTRKDELIAGKKWAEVIY